MRKKKLALLLILTLLLTSCGTGKNVPANTDIGRVIVTGEGNTVVTASDDADAVPTVDLSDFDTMTEADDVVTISLNGTSAQCDSDDVTVEAGRITITDAGSYLLSGSFTGQIVVQAGADDNVHLILSGVEIAGDMAPVYIAHCKNASITLASGTVNSVSDGQNYTFADGEDEPDAAIFSDCDLTINGDGTLNVTGNYACGIRTKDDLRIVSGNINVTSVGDAIKGRDSLQIAGGNFNIISGADGLKSNNDEDADRGYIVIDGGNFTISAGDDGVHAESRLTVNGGNLTVTSSYEGLEAMKVELNGGNIDITASDDALNAASPSTGDTETDDWFGQQDQHRDSGMGGFGSMTPPGGMEMPDDMTPTDGMPDGMTPTDGMPDDMTPPGGTDVSNGAAQPEMPGSRDRNSGFDRGDRGGRGDKGGNMGGGFGGKMGMGGETPEDGVWIRITGGNIRLCGGVDVLDSNGTIEISGGTVIVDTPRLQIYGNPDGVFDANGDVTLSGGTYAAYAQSTGSIAGITQNPSLTVSSRIASGTAVEVKSADGDVIFSDTAKNGGSVFFITSDLLKSGEEYTVTVGENAQTVAAQ